MPRNHRVVSDWKAKLRNAEGECEKLRKDVKICQEEVSSEKATRIYEQNVRIKLRDELAQKTDELTALRVRGSGRPHDLQLVSVNGPFNPKP